MQILGGNNRLAIAPIRREIGKEYVSRAGRPKHTTLNLDIPHTYSLGNNSSIVLNMQGSIEFSVRNVEYQLFYIFSNRFSWHSNNKIRNSDVILHIEMSTVKFDRQIFSMNIEINIEQANNSTDLSVYLINQFDAIFFSKTNDLLGSWGHLFDEFGSLENVYHVTLNGFLVIAVYYFDQVKKQIQIMLPLPPERRELFQDRQRVEGLKKENAVEFVERVWGDYISANRLFGEHISILDSSLFDALIQMSNFGEISISRYIRNIEMNATKRVSSCISELAEISKINPELNESMYRIISKLNKDIGDRLTGEK